MKYLTLFAFFGASPAFAGPVFENLSQNLPPHEYSGGWDHFVGGGVAVLDCNGDTLPDVFAAGGTGPASLFINEGDFKFHAGDLPEITETTGAYPVDIDADGQMDLFVLRIGANRVLKGDADCSFTDVTADYGVPETDQWSTSFSAWWVDDGLPYMAVGNYVDRSNPKGPFFACDSNTLLTPEGGTYTATSLEPGFCALSMLAARDASGTQRLRISNDRQYYVRGGYEQMWDIGEARFLGEEDGWAKVSLWGMGIASRDLNGDGRDEVMLTSMGDQLLQIATDEGLYTAAPFNMGTAAHRPYLGDDGRPSTGWHAQFGDVDNDGRADLFIAKGNVDQMPSNAIHDPNNMLMQQPDGHFVEAALEAGLASGERARGAALADFDNDGRLDVLVLNRRAPLEIYRNVTPDTGAWLNVALEQGGGNRNAIGAQITVEAGSFKETQQVTIGGGHAGGQALPLHFGLGDAVEAMITVEWPNGTVTTTTAPVNQTLTLTH
jgi:hypothetical protein